MIVVLSTDAVEMDKVDPRLAGAVGENLAARRVLTSNDSTVYSRSIGKQSAPKRQSAPGLDEIPPAESAHTQSLPVPERRPPRLATISDSVRAESLFDPYAARGSKTFVCGHLS